MFVLEACCDLSINAIRFSCHCTQIILLACLFLYIKIKLFCHQGLGKTLQTISLLAYLRESRGVKGPHLCVVPKSVVGNWMREIKKWCPAIRPMRMGGTKEERAKFMQQGMSQKEDGTWHCKFDVLITSYEGVCKEKGRFRKVAWKYVIIDEAHRIKNEKSALSLVVRQMNTQFRMLITGTPLQVSVAVLLVLCLRCICFVH